MTNGNLFVVYVNLSDIGLISFIFRSNYPYQVDAQCNRSISSFGMWSHHHPLYSTFSVAYFPKVFIGDKESKYRQKIRVLAGSYQLLT